MAVLMVHIATGVPHFLLFYFLNVPGADWCLVQELLCTARHQTKKAQKQISSKTAILMRYQKESLRTLNRLKPCSSSKIVFALSAREMIPSYALCIANICF
jgi:hypothetical protein